MEISALPRCPLRQPALAGFDRNKQTFANSERGHLVLKFLLVLSILGLAFYARQMLLSFDANRKRIYEEKYSLIKEYMTEKDVELILGEAGVQESNPELPKSLGDIPGYEKVTQVQINGWLDITVPYEVNSTRPVSWRKWLLSRDGDCWIAVAFVEVEVNRNWKLTSVVMKKKSGF